MKVGILGSGDVARALGTGFVASGHHAMLGSRAAGNPKIAEWVKTTGGNGSGGTFADAAKFGEIVVVAALGAATPDVIAAAGPDLLAGKVVIDVTNPLKFEGQGPPALALGFNTSAGEELQKLVPRARVVKAFNIIGNAHFYRPTFPGGPPDMFICGNDEAAKRTVTEILHEFGWPSVIDTGGIEGARELESLCILWVKSAFKLQSFDIGFKLLRK
jgi:8-hydroxy-5-deazaflavin:NADPH oxidoreductase